MSDTLDLEHADAEDAVLPRAPEDDTGGHVKKRWGIGFWLSAVWLLAIVVLSVGAPYLPFVEEPGAFPDFSIESLAGPSADHWFGVNQNGDDLFSQVVNGGRTSLLIGGSVVFFGFVVGGAIGIAAGFYGGRTDRIISAILDVFLAFPALVLALALIGIVTGGDANLPVVILALSLLSVAPLARITRGTTLAVAEREYVLAARTLGARQPRIIAKEILPNVVPPMAAFALTVIAVVIVAEGALAFLGLSVSSPAPTWGKLIAEGRAEIENHGHWALFPAGTMFLTILSLNYIGDVLQSRFTVREGAL
ncbi:MAG TPA: ABC transporter permease [Acidimicrobiaceae bacterium]|nr:ABC transporter permease [Acidimicrobiaceae bacterium]